MHIRKLQKAIENAEVKQKMDMEDSILDELTEMERLIDNLGEENVQVKHENEQVKHENEQKKFKIEELENELTALRKLLEDKGK